MCKPNSGEQNKVQVAPSILSADFANLAKSCEEVLLAGANMLHVDVMDGIFVPNISIGVPVVKSLSKAFPEVFLDVHLMIITPLKYIFAFADAGASLISFHIEAESGVQETIDAIHATGCKAGIVIKPNTNVEESFSYLKDVEWVLVMSVEPGFGGQEFMPEALNKIKAIKNYAEENNLNNLQIQVDGGINKSTAHLVIESGADILVAGSAIFGAEDKKKAIHEIRNA